MSKFSSLRWAVAVLGCLCLLAAGLHAQDYRGKVQGAVTDSSGAVIPNAKVVLRNVKTGVEATRQTDANGRYIFDFVESGTYTVIVEQAGFKRSVQENVVMRNLGDLTVDARLDVGEVAESVTVQDSGAQVEFNTSSAALTIDNKIVDQLPIRGRNAYNISALDPTVSPATGSTANENRPYHHAFANEIDAGGGTIRANDVLLDGVPLTSSYKTSYTPNLEAVQEVTFQKNAVDAEYGYSAGGVVVLNMKSGTNTYHGSAFAYGRSPRFNAVSDPTLLRTGGTNEYDRRGTKLNIFGASLGGPILRNKLFFYSTYEKWNESQPLSLVLTVPTQLERQGNFSQSVRGGAIRAIFDPFTSTGSSGARTAFAGNIIPSSRFDPVAVRLLAQIPLPNLPGNTDNLQVSKTNRTQYWNFSTRVDWNYSEKWKTFVRYGHFKANLLEDNPTSGALLPINGSNRYGLSLAADTVYILSPKWVLNVRGNFHQLTDEYAAETAQIGSSGLSQLFGGNTFYTPLYTGPNVYYPALDLVFGSTTYRFGRPGREFFQHPQGFGGSVRMNYYAGSHSVKFGGEYRTDKGKGARFEPLNFSLRQTFTANANTSPNLNTSGSEWASFLLGVIDNNSSARLVPLQEVVTKGYSAYVQDDWKVNSRLTLNLGLRWEYEPGPVDAQNRLTRRLDLTNPIPEFQTTPPAIPFTVTNLLTARNIRQQFTGAWVFTDSENRNVYQRDRLNLLPRIGGAFRINNNSALRLGYARFMTPASRVRDALGDFVNQYSGYAAITTASSFLSGVPRATLSNPFPATTPVAPLIVNPVQAGRAQTLGRYTNLGNSIGTAGNAVDGLDAPFQKPPLNDRFNISYQRGIWGKMVVDLEYFFNNGHRLPYAVDINAVDPEFSYTVARSVLNQTVANPFFNILTPAQFPGTLRNSATVTVGSLLRPFPQYGVINQTNIPGRKERLHSLSAQLQRPYSKGLSFVVSYAYNREQTTEFYDDIAAYNRQFTWYDTEAPRHRMTNAITWDIPIGRGRRLFKDAPKALNLVVGGWQLTSTSRFYSGRLLTFGQNLIVNGDPRISNPTKGVNGLWFNTAVFSALPTSTNAADPPNLRRRNNPRNFPGLRGPSVTQTDMTMSKSFSITERFRLETRVETYNVFNQLNWENPGVDFNNPGTFGKVTRKHVAYVGREVQYGLRLVF